MADRARDESGKFVASALADGSQSEAPILPANEPGETTKPRGPVAGSSGTDEKLNAKRAELNKKQDDILNRIFGGGEFKDKTPEERAEVAATEAKEQSETAAKAADAEAKKIQERASTPDRKRAEKAVELLGIKQSVIDKMDDGELFELAAHRTKVDNDVSQRLARLSELEKKQQTATANTTQPRSEEPAGQGLNIAESAKPLLDVLALDESALPAVEKFARSILGAAEQRIAALEATVRGTSEAFTNDMASLTRDQLAERFQGLKDDAVWPRVEARMDALAATGFYTEAAPTMRGKMSKLMADACLLEGLTETKPSVDRAALSKAKANGDVSVSSTVRTTKGMKPSEVAYQNALRAIEKFG